MAGEYIIKVKALLDKQDAREMEEDLNSRFNNVARKFRTSIGRGLKRLAISGLLTAAVGTILNDIDKLNSAIDDTLEKYKDIKTTAGSLGLTGGEYFKLSELSKVAGVQNFDALFQAFKSELQRANRGAPSVLQEFRGQQADPETFLQVLSSLGQAGKDRNVLAGAVFGEGNVGNVNKLLQADLNYLAEKMFAGIDDNTLEQAIIGGFGRYQNQQVLAFRRNLEEMLERGQKITPQTLKQQDNYLRADAAFTTKQIDSYEDAANVQRAMLTAQTAIVTGVQETASWTKKIYNGLQRQNEIEKDRREGRISQAEYERRTEENQERSSIFR